MIRIGTLFFLLIVGCSEDKKSCEKNTDCQKGQICDPQTGSCIEKQDGGAEGKQDGGVEGAEGKQDGGAEGKQDSGVEDNSTTPDRLWDCAVIPEMKGGMAACDYTWTCKDGKYVVSCKYDIENNEYFCKCHNPVTNAIAGAFKGSSPTCVNGSNIIIQDINKICGWKLLPY